jgi:5'-nucleotidase
MRLARPSVPAVLVLTASSGLLTLSILAAPLAAAPDEVPDWPRRVLLTNDDGIAEPRLHALARAFAASGCETWVVASFGDRSGTSNHISLGKYGRTLLARREHVEENLVLYGVAGYPADAVLLGVAGLLAETPPDLVVSGVNGGPNLGVDGWWGSGTIGAARTAAFLGFPAVAVSGLDDDDLEMVDRVTGWVVRLASSPVVRDLAPGEYLTVAVPQIRADEIRGIRVAPRSVSLLDLELERVAFEEDGGETEEVWLLGRGLAPDRIAAGSDVALLEEGWIVVTPMRVGEVDEAALADLAEHAAELPAWAAADATPAD